MKQSDNKTVTVLLVEDDSNDARLIEYALSRVMKTPYQVVCAGRLSQARECLCGREVDIILLDLGLPDGYGLTTFDQIHALTPLVPVIVLTGQDNDELAVEAVRRGAQDFLVKGRFDSGLLYRSLHYAIERNRMLIELRQAQEALRASEMKYRKIFENVQDVLYQADANGNLLDISPSITNHTGYAREELIGKSEASLYADPDAGSRLSQAIEEKGRVSDYELIVRAKDGRLFPASLNARIVYDQAGRPAGREGVWRDISERKKMEEERLKHHVLESIGILAGGIAHDFNNLLNVINGDIYIAKKLLQPEDKTYCRLTDAEQVCEIAGELSRRLITFATGGDPVRKTMQMSELLAGTIGGQLKGSAIKPEFDLPEDLRPVAIDEGQMKQVFANLVMNAKEAMPEGGTLTIRGENLTVASTDNLPMSEGEYVRISIGDTGVGIAPQNLAKVFDPYFSTKNTYHERGLGLSLAVCYSVLKRHNGLLTVESEVGRGTTFHLYLPVAGRMSLREEGGQTWSEAA
ncbi:MAG TPA: PAS domain S-box protein [Nitrospirota bacterium]|nr:PAS domain S-box protein [Nitrospirota bacterium]